MRRAMVVTLAAMTVVPAEAADIEFVPQLAVGIELVAAPSLPGRWGVGLVAAVRAKAELHSTDFIAPTVGGQLRVEAFGDRTTQFTATPTLGAWMIRPNDAVSCNASTAPGSGLVELRPGLLLRSRGAPTSVSLGLGGTAMAAPYGVAAEIRSVAPVTRPDAPTPYDRRHGLLSIGPQLQSMSRSCYSITVGRPLRLTPDPSDVLTLPDVTAQASTPAADAWLRRAQEELAAVLAFARLARELEAIGAPASLVARCEAAARDEHLHGRLCLERAVAHGAGRVDVDALEAPVRTWPSREQALAHLGYESLHDGFVNEGHAARDAWERAAQAEDAADIAAFERIARDETRHAWLGADIAAWCQRALAA